MNWETIKTNLASTAIIAILSIATGFLFGTSQMNAVANDVDAIKKDLGSLQANDRAQREFLDCVRLVLDRLNNGIKTGQVCELKAN